MNMILLKRGVDTARLVTKKQIYPEQLGNKNPPGEYW